MARFQRILQQFQAILVLVKGPSFSNNLHLLQLPHPEVDVGAKALQQVSSPKVLWVHQRHIHQWCVGLTQEKANQGLHICSRSVIRYVKHAKDPASTFEHNNPQTPKPLNP